MNVNPGDMNGECPLEKFQYIRVINFNKNAFESIDKILALPYLYDLNATHNQIASIGFMAESKKNF